MNGFTEDLRSGVMIMDGAMGTMLRGMGHYVPDEANLTAPDRVRSIHRAYLSSGADIIKTNTFNATTIALNRPERDIRIINAAGVALALEASAGMLRETGRRSYVAGDIGPTHVALTKKGRDDYERLRGAFALQAHILIESGVDLLLVESVYDSVNGKAAMEGVTDALKRADREVPVIVSATVIGSTGRLLSGETPVEFLSMIDSPSVVAVGLNCSSGIEALSPLIRDVAKGTDKAVLFCPSAGLPDDSGAYPEVAGRFAKAFSPLIDDGVVQIVGGCCGTTPEHIAALRYMVNNK